MFQMRHTVVSFLAVEEAAGPSHALSGDDETRRCTAIGHANDQPNQSNHILYGIIQACRLLTEIGRSLIDLVYSFNRRILSGYRIKS